MNRAETLATNLAQVRERITRAEARAGRKPGSVTLVAVSKKMPASDVLASLQAGQIDFGENYAQELRDKRVEVQNSLGALAKPAWHFIGPLQGNKAKYVAGTAALIHSLDSTALLDEVNRRVPENLTQRCLVQVNVADEGQKRGVSTANLATLLDHFARCPRLSCEGFMLIPPQSDEPESARPFFRALRELLATHASVPRPGVRLAELSMGMSHDLEVAVEEGATLVRVGTAIYGARV
jgi:PLP dependent protein